MVTSMSYDQTRRHVIQSGVIPRSNGLHSSARCWRRTVVFRKRICVLCEGLVNESCTLLKRKTHAIGNMDLTCVIRDTESAVKTDSTSIHPSTPFSHLACSSQGQEKGRKLLLRKLLSSEGDRNEDGICGFSIEALRCRNLHIVWMGFVVDAD